MAQGLSTPGDRALADAERQLEQAWEQSERYRAALKMIVEQAGADSPLGSIAATALDET